MSQFQLFKDVIKRYGFGELFKQNEQAMRITCTQNGNLLFGSGLDDLGKITSIADVTDIWLEEPIDRRGTVSSSDFTELNRRLRSVKASNHIHLTFNPISKESWIHDYFFKSDLYKPFVLKTTYLDNHFTPESQRNEFEILRQKKPDEYAVYALGEWGSLKQGLVFPEYTIVQDFPTDCKRWGYGLDWGFYPDPTALVRCGTKDGKLYLDEVIYENNLTSATRAEMMKRRGVLPSVKIIADPNPEAIAEMKTKGYWNIEAAKKGEGSIKEGISQMRSFEICITQRSQNLKTELDNYEWERDRQSESPTGKAVDAWNHAIDAARYWTMANAVQKTVRIHSTAR
jgi:phage terminase large subunit